MARPVYDRYLEAEVLSADPVKLVWLLNRAAIDAVRAAARHVARGEIRERSEEINRAWGILQELSSSLDRSQGGQISRGLADLYAYMQARLIEANVKQSAGPLEEVAGLLAPLLEAWQEAQQALQAAESRPESKTELEVLALG
jgi:flagellar protein FliS